MTRHRRIAAVAAMVLATAIPAGPAGAMRRVRPAAAVVDGLWMNPYRSVAVRTGECGGRLCGWVVWANAEAIADARDGGTPQLIGVALLRGYGPNRDGSWSGQIYVPDMGRQFSSTITPIGPDTLKLKGCLIGGFLCRTQVWSRIEHVPA